MTTTKIDGLAQQVAQHLNRNTHTIKMNHL